MNNRSSADKYPRIILDNFEQVNPYKAMTYLILKQLWDLLNGKFNGYGWKMQVFVNYKPSEDRSMDVQKGGIDLTPANMNLQTQNKNGEIKFHLDLAMRQQLQNATGFVPVIIHVEPLKSLPEFLGLAPN
jgi:hypothetical protein